MPAAKDVMIFGKALVFSRSSVLCICDILHVLFKGYVKIGSLVFSVNANN